MIQWEDAETPLLQKSSKKSSSSFLLIVLHMAMFVWVSSAVLTKFVVCN